jgi:serine/threonine protein kinase
MSAYSKNKTIFISPEEKIVVNTLICEGGKFCIPGTEYKVNWKSFNIFPHYDKFTLRENLLIPSSKYVEIAKLEPVKKRSGVYGEVKIHKELKSVVKRFKLKSSGENPKSDFIREVAIYSLLEGEKCIPKRFGVCFEKQKIQMEALSTDLFRMDKSVFTNEKIIKTMFSLVKCLRASATQGIIHCDVKPDNCAYDENGDAKLVDWGLAEIDQSLDQLRPKSCCVQTQHYQAPEIMVANMEKRSTAIYSYKIDVFSLGAIFLYLYTGREFVFKTRKLQLKNVISKFTGFPMPCLRRKNKILRIAKEAISGNSVAEYARGAILSSFKRNSVSISGERISTKMPEEMADLISHMVEPNPHHRWSYDQIILHPLFQNIARIHIRKIPKLLNNMPIIANINNSWNNAVAGDIGKIRNILYSWIRDVAVKVKLCKPAFCTGIQLMDLFVSKCKISELENGHRDYTPENRSENRLARNLIQGYGIACLILASKIYDCDYLENATATYLCDSLYVEGQIVEFQRDVMKTLGGNLLIPSLWTYYSSVYPDESGVKIKNLLSMYLRSDIYSRPFSESWREICGV